VNILGALRRNKIFIIGIIILAFFEFGYSLLGNFIAVDDVPVIVKGTLIRDLWASVSTHNILKILWSIIYHVFGAHPFPFHLLSLILHITNVILLIFIAEQLFDKKVAIFASLLFLLHPVNTEAVAWISGGNYLYFAIAAQLAILSFIRYRKTGDSRDFYLCLSIFILTTIFIGGVWVYLIPIYLLFVDIFFLRKKIDLILVKDFRPFFIAILVLALIFGIFSQSQSRISSMQNIYLLPDKQMIPFIETAPFAITTMVSVYIFPLILKFYYEGIDLSTYFHTTMFIVPLIYLGLIGYFFKRDKKISGLLILLLATILPTLSPRIVAMYMAERYLYLGATFFCMLLAFTLIKIQSVVKVKNLSLYLLLLICIFYSVRTFIRTLDFRNTKQLVLATIKILPNSIHVQSDLAYVYMDEKNYKEATRIYNNILTKSPDLSISTHNLGYIYITQELPTEDLKPPKSSKSVEQLVLLADSNYKVRENGIAFFYYYQALQNQPDLEYAKQQMANIFYRLGMIDKAQQILK
jgi:tetratricopeptide (TPR) repeat protein